VRAARAVPNAAMVNADLYQFAANGSFRNADGPNDFGA
jgi:hypothetical protein